jgi:DNA-binding transcriptional LysR family regulator
MDLRQLRTFEQVARLGTVSGAAAALHVTQPALSRQLQRLERQVGVALFSRDGGRLKLTRAGQTFLDATLQVLATLNAAEAVADHLRAGRLRRLSIAAPTTTLTDVLAPFLASLLQSDPVTTVEEAHYAAALDALRSHCDMAILTAPPPRQLRSFRVAVLPVWAYLRAGHELTGREEISIADLAAERLILLEPRFRPRQLVDEALIAAGLSPVDVIECSNPQVAQALAAAGHGTAVLSDDPRFGLDRCAIRHAGGLLTLTLHAAWRADHHACDQLEGFALRLQAFCADRYGTITVLP